MSASLPHPQTMHALSEAKQFSALGNGTRHLSAERRSRWSAVSTAYHGGNFRPTRRCSARFERWPRRSANARSGGHARLSRYGVRYEESDDGNQGSSLEPNRNVIPGLAPRFVSPDCVRVLQRVPGQSFTPATKAAQALRPAVNKGLQSPRASGGLP